MNPTQSDERLCEAGIYGTYRVVGYHPERLPADVRAALDASPASDTTLQKAGAYFRRGLFLSQEAWRHVHPGSFHWALAVSEAMLNYFKAATLILGDPTKDHDYQSRYRRFGMARELWKRVDHMRGRRNNYDVAHYERGWGALEVVDRELVEAKATTQEVLEAYKAYLARRSGIPSTP
jgi:hypothetical protein